MHIIFLLFFSSFLWSGGKSFITPEEYGKMLYRNPRGIGCHLCHGLNGDGKILGNYTTKRGKVKKLKIPKINNLSYNVFRNIFYKKRKRKIVMPTYFLIESEIKTLYQYLQKKKNKDMKR